MRSEAVESVDRESSDRNRALRRAGILFSSKWRSPAANGIF